MNMYRNLDDTVEGFTLTIEHDELHCAPWENEDGHGPVSDWTTRAKRPGELILSSARGRHCYYDFAEACRIACRDGWGFLPGNFRTEHGANSLVRLHVETFIERRCETISTAWHDDMNDAIAALYAAHKATFPSDRAYHCAAARHDFELLRKWCDDEWHYCVVTVRNDETGESNSIGGIASDDEITLLECANSALEELRND